MPMPNKIRYLAKHLNDLLSALKHLKPWGD